MAACARYNIGLAVCTLWRRVVVAPGFQADLGGA